MDDKLWTTDAMLRTSMIATLCVFAAGLRGPARADWPEFRGPLGNGYVAVSNDPVGEIPLTWSESQNIRWKTPIPFRGWSTPVVMGGQIWLTTATEDGHDFFVICVDSKTGKILRNNKVFHCDSPEPLGNNVNCYATPSAAIEPGHVYVHFGTYGTACLDTKTGNVIWQRDDLHCRHYRGPSSSVVLFEHLVILTFDGVDVQYTVALDKQNGQNVWKTDRDVQWNDQDVTGKSPREAQLILDGDRRKAHSTPLVFRDAAGRPQLLSVGAKSAFAYDPRTGHELWRVRFDDFSVAPRTLYQDGIAYLVTGLTHPELWAVHTDGSGDVTDTHVLWRLKSRVSKTASPVLVDNLIYMVSDDGILNCIDAATGTPVWSHRLGGRFAASPIYVGSATPRIYFCDEDGQTTVIKPGRKFEQLAANTLEDGCMASPAVDGAAIILRTKTNLYRIAMSP
jgi:outer membrane protein assembly factor BamB